MEPKELSIEEQFYLLNKIKASFLTRELKNKIELKIDITEDLSHAFFYTTKAHQLSNHLSIRPSNIYILLFESEMSLEERKKVNDLLYKLAKITLEINKENKKKDVHISTEILFSFCCTLPCEEVEQIIKTKVNKTNRIYLLPYLLLRTDATDKIYEYAVTHSTAVLLTDSIPPFKKEKISNLLPSFLKLRNTNA